MPAAEDIAGIVDKKKIITIFDKNNNNGVTVVAQKKTRLSERCVHTA